MPKSVSKRYSRIALLAVLALIASLFVLPIAPAGATDGEADDTATYTACPSDVIPDAGFTDTASSFATSEIDCIAYYGITQGAGSPTTYKPGSQVLRWQMALFLIRAAGPAGITVPAATDQGFTDIGGLPQATQDAINQLAALGITQGKGTATTFVPMDPVTRQQMALFLARFLDDVTVGPGGVDIDDVDPDDDVFTDIGQVSVEMYDAIRNLFELGVTTGTGDGTTFSPTSVVSRAQMAAFISRSLAHSNARPAGVNIQSDISSGFGALAPELSVTVRDSSFMPVEDALVDVFRFEPSTDVEDAFASDGSCVTTGEVDATSTGPDECEIDISDNTTDADGNADLTGAVTAGATATFYAWTGSSGDDFDEDTTSFSSVAVTSSEAATDWLVTTTIPDNATTAQNTSNDGTGNLVKYGTSVTHTFQLVDADEDPVADAGEDVTVQVRTYVNGTLTASAVVTETTDANGSLSFELGSKSDPDTAAGDDDDTLVTVEILSSDGPDATNAANLVNDVPNDDFDVLWDDDDSDETEVVVATVNDYVEASASGDGASNTVTATVYDQYGLGMSGVTVTFTSDDAESQIDLETSIDRNTNSSGVATLSYERDSANTNDETVTGTVGGLNDDATVYWTMDPSDPGTYDTATAVLVADTDADVIVFESAGADDIGEFIHVPYDTGDQFNDGGAVSYDAFEDDIDAGDMVTVLFDGDGVSVLTITVDN